MRLNHLTAWLVIDLRLQILDQGTIAPHVDGLGAGADAQNWLVEVEGVLQEQFVYGGAAWVRLTALGNWIFAISLWVNVVTAAGQQYAMHPRKQLGHAILALMERNHNRRCTGGVKRG
jgi:hypothetical protein